MNKFMFSSVAVVGGTGFLGRHVVAALREAGVEPCVLSRRTGIDDLRGCEAVVNLAGIKREEGAQTFRAVHVDLPRRLIESMKIAGARRLIHVSVVVAREAPELPYHHTKWQGEEVVRGSGLDWTILRPGVIYGEGDDLLSHLTMMVRAAPVFPIVGDGSAPMMPVDARDVAAAVVSALRNPGSAGRVYDVVGPDRLKLRDVVGRVAEAVDLPVSIWPTPVALMRLPVRLMEATMREPLSTRAQLAMLVEGLAGDPEPARRDLGIDPGPFTPDRLRPLVATIERRAPFTLRLGTRPSRETSPSSMVVLYALAASLLTLVLAAAPDRWMGMTFATAILLAGSLFLPSVRRRLRPRPFGVIVGIAAGFASFGVTLVGMWILDRLWPGWRVHADELFAWRGNHSTAMLGTTLVMIVLAEEVLWRGVIARFWMERLGRGGGIIVGALLYVAAHVASFNPVLLMAALFLGLFWGWLYAATDDLVVPTLCHLSWDAMVLFGI